MHELCVFGSRRVTAFCVLLHVCFVLSQFDMFFGWAVSHSRLRPDGCVVGNETKRGSLARCVTQAKERSGGRGGCPDKPGTSPLISRVSQARLRPQISQVDRGNGLVHLEYFGRPSTHETLKTALSLVLGLLRDIAPPTRCSPLERSMTCHDLCLPPTYVRLAASL